MLEKFIMFIDKTLKWCLIIKIVMKHLPIYISSSSIQVELFIYLFILYSGRANI